MYRQPGLRVTAALDSQSPGGLGAATLGRPLEGDKLSGGAVRMQARRRGKCFLGSMAMPPRGSLKEAQPVAPPPQPRRVCSSSHSPRQLLLTRMVAASQPPRAVALRPPESCSTPPPRDAPHEALGTHSSVHAVE